MMNEMSQPEVRWKKFINVVAKTLVLVVFIGNTNHW